MADETNTRAAADKQAQLEERETLSGLAAAFQHAREMGPQLLTLQAVLIQGLALGQRREAARLAGLDETDPRRAEAEARAERAETLRRQAELGSGVAGRLVGGLQAQGLFHGYVFQAGGAPAAGYRVQVRGAEGEPLPMGRKPADVGEDGYFRFEADAKAADRAAAAPARNAFSALGERLAEVQAASAAAGPHAEAASAVVEVLDPSGRTVFADPSPPDFASGASAFRYYLVPDAAGGRKAAGSTRKKPG